MTVMARVPSRFALLAAAALCVAVPAAEAQIYNWRDANGTLVLSDRPRNPSARTVSVGRSGAFRTTRVPASPTPARYETLIERHATVQGVRPDLVRAVIQVESAFNPRAVSSKGAMGLMQLMPGTAAELGVTDPFNPSENIRGGVTYLRQLLTRYDENEELALAAYNAGPSAVAHYGNRIPPYRETQQFVGRVKRRIDIAIDIATIGSRSENTIYKSYDVVNGRQIPRYSNVKPTGEYEIAARRR